MKRGFFLSATLIIVVLFTSCKKETGPAGPAGPELTGSIIGYVSLYNSLGDRIVNTKGVSVYIDGATPKTVYTDSIGEYKLDSIKTGIYNITFSKDSFNTFKKLGQQLVGGSDPVISNVILYVPSVNAVSNLALTITGNSHVTAAGTLSHPGYYGYYRYYIGINSSVNDTNYVYTGTFNVTGLTLNNQIINTDAFQSGSTIYLIIYGITTGDAGYIDVANGDTYYPSLCTKPSNIASIVIP
jgi:hypothetical protein